MERHPPYGLIVPHALRGNASQDAPRPLADVDRLEWAQSALALAPTQSVGAIRVIGHFRFLAANAPDKGSP